MVSVHGSVNGEGERVGHDGGRIRFVQYLKANRKVAYVLLVMVMVHLSSQYDRYLFSVSKIPFMDSDSFQFALIAGPFFTAVNATAGVVLSFVGDVRPVRLLSTACLVWSACTGAVAFSGKFWQVALSRVGQGIGDAACCPFAASILKDNFGPDVIGSAMGVFYVGLFAGFSLSLGGGTLIDDLLGWRWAYILAAAAGFVSAGVTYATVQEPRKPLSVSRQRRDYSVASSGGTIKTPTASEMSAADGSFSVSRSPWGGGRGGGGSRSVRSVSSPTYSLVRREEEAGEDAKPAPAHAAGGGGGGGESKDDRGRGDSETEAGARTGAPSTPEDWGKGFQQALKLSIRRFREGKLQDVSDAWLASPSLLLICLAGGVRDAGGFVFSYYLASYFSPLLDGNPTLTGFGQEPCSYSYNASYNGTQICNEDFPWCVDGLCNQLTSSPWHDVGMPASHLELFVSWVPLIGGSLGAMLGGILSDRIAKRHGTGGRLWVVVVSNAVASPFAVGVLVAPYPWCFLCLLMVSFIGEMWIGIMVTCIMTLVPRHVRVTSVALYNFFITNLSGLCTLLVPPLRAQYETRHVFSFFAEPLAGASAAAAAVAAAAAAVAGGGGASSSWPIDSAQPLPSLRGFVGEEMAMAAFDTGGLSGGVGGGGEGGGAGDPVEYRVMGSGSSSLRAAMMWIYPGLYLASSVFSLAAIIALGRDKRNEEEAAAAAAAEADYVELHGGDYGGDGWLSPTSTLPPTTTTTTTRFEVRGPPVEGMSRGRDRAPKRVSGGGIGRSSGRSTRVGGDGGGIDALDVPLLHGVNEDGPGEEEEELSPTRL